jgi:hypothetical protein
MKQRHGVMRRSNQKLFDMGDIVLLRRPGTESPRKLESKWVGSYVVIEKSRLGAYRISNS